MSVTLADLTEKQWQAQVVQLFRQLNWKGYHTHDSRRSQPGFPDIVLVRERVVYLELKREKGKLTAKQREWLLALLNTGAEAYVARPGDLEALGRVLAHRGDPWRDGRGLLVAVASLLRDRTWREVLQQSEAA